MNTYENVGHSSRLTQLLRLLNIYKVYILAGLAALFFITTIVFASRPPKRVEVPTGPTTATPPVALCPNPYAVEQRFNCHPEPGATRERCDARKCCWSPITEPELGAACFFPENYRGYYLSDVQGNEYRTVATLRRSAGYESGFRLDVQTLNIEITATGSSTARVRITDPSQSRYEVPLPQKLNSSPIKSGDLLYSFNITADAILIITRKSTGTVILNSDLKRMVYSDQFIQIDWDLPSSYIYGLSEHKTSFRQNVTWKQLTIFNRGEQPRDSYKAPNLNLYGTHPMYLMVEGGETQLAHGIFLLNSNAMDVILQPKPAITWRTVGGILDIFVYLGPSPNEVIKQHVTLIGTPSIPPYWSLGFHLSRYGYNSTESMVEAWNRTVMAGIPLDCQWSDIDAMAVHDDFTYDKTNFSGLPDHVKTLHDKGMKWVPILDPGVSNKEDGAYAPYDDGMALDVFVKNQDGTTLQGKVWNRNTTVFVDFTNPKAFLYWAKQAESFYKEIPFDGLWIDMNEPYNFLNGSIVGCPEEDPLENPQYVPGGDPLHIHTLCMTAKHYLGNHYDVHSLYAHYETAASNYALAGLLGKRPFVLSRANFAGHGHFGAHWTGDIDSSVDMMKGTIPAMLTFNMYGVPMIGADICGFQRNTTDDLCARWSSLGAFYPFSRNHNDYDTIEQDPVSLGPDVTNAAKKALLLRYRLLPYLYTLFYEAHSSGSPVIRPLFFEFIADSSTADIEEQFMWGSALMVVPVLELSSTSVSAYFPAGKWYDVETRTLLVDSKGEQVDLNVPIDEIRVVLRQGQLIVTQDPDVTTAKSRLNPFRLLVSLDDNGGATGSLFWDSGESINSVRLGLFNLIEFRVSNQKLTALLSQFGYPGKMPLVEVQVLNVNSKPIAVTVNDQPWTEFEYSKGSLTVNSLAIDLTKDFSISWK
ncbi:Lysosomal alpha-glucosidase [Halotydeus destructor]|nr:Lysosomal alpha-glucosidase [Halotydeus destructor]